MDDDDFNDALRAEIYSLAFMLWNKEGDLPQEIVDLIEEIIRKERMG